MCVLRSHFGSSARGLDSHTRRTQPAMAATAPLPPTAEDVKKLQVQVDELRERLDFISPMLPLVNFVQDFFQKVECEASLQILRLQNAQVLRPKQVGEEDEVATAQLETVKYFHFLVDAITSLHGSASLGQSCSQGAADAESRPGSPSARASPSLLNSVSRGMVQPPARATLCSPMTHSTGLHGGPSTLTSPTSPTARSSASLFSQSNNGAGGSPEQLAPAQRMASEGGFLLASGGGPTPVRGHAGAPAPMRTGCAPSHGPMGPTHTEPCFVSEPLAEPGTGGTYGGGEVCSDLDGRVLGKGSWARAFRQASGARLEALRLLCRSSIVTPRELSDDLTVISQEHINECVQIASEMLQTWTLDMWAQQPEEAKKFFEARLTALYQRKFGEVKG